MKKTLYIVILTLISLCYILVANQTRRISRIVFCDVGQGDAIYLRLPEQIDVLIDAGSYPQVLNCLNSEMPYLDRKLEMAFITHPEKDHYKGFDYILDSFKIETLYLPASIENLKIDNPDWQAFFKKAKKNIKEIVYLSSGDELCIENSCFTVVSPNISKASHSILGATNFDFNNNALALVALVNSKQILLLSDLDIAPAERAIEQLNLDVDIFKVNHHGSKYGISDRLLDLADPKLSVISVGANNWYGHPHPETIELLQSHNIPIKRTDKQGKVIIPL